MQYGCIGEKLTHSFSKEIHSMLANYEYELKEVPNSELEDFIKKADFKAVNVTIPYKQAVIPFLDYVSEKAKQIGAVNTIVKKEGKLYGYNTDFYGMTELIKKNNIEINNKKVLILGSGGTYRTAKQIVKSLGAEKIIGVSRTESENFITYEQAENLYSDFEIIINTTPVGMYPETDNMPIDISKFKNLQGVVDAIYNPLNSKLVLTAKKRGIKATGGLYMLVKQAAEAVYKFTVVKPDEEKVENAYKTVLKSKQNLVLTGMPGSGKSTIGKGTAKLLNRKFADTDELIVKETGMSIPEIFEKYGESGFRKIESKVISNISKQSGMVIATGGGSVLSSENMFKLSQNGIIVFINRKLQHITATKGRPLSKDKQKIAELYKERINIYKSTADKIIDPVFSVKENINKTAKEFLNENFSN